jgi:hypothetical protein
MFLTRLEISYDSILIQAKDQVQSKGIALSANKATLIIRRVVQFHMRLIIQREKNRPGDHATSNTVAPALADFESDSNA